MVCEAVTDGRVPERWRAERREDESTDGTEDDKRRQTLFVRSGSMDTIEISFILEQSRWMTGDSTVSTYKGVLMTAFQPGGRTHVSVSYGRASLTKALRRSHDTRTFFDTCRDIFLCQGQARELWRKE